MRFTVLLVALLVSTAPAARTLDSNNALSVFVDELVAALDAGKAVEVLEMLREVTSIPEAEFAGNISASRTQLRFVDAQAGPVVGAVLACSQKSEDTIARFTVIEKRLRAPMIWQFYFYRPGNEWKLILFNATENATLAFFCEARRYDSARVPVA